MPFNVCDNFSFISFSTKLFNSSSVYLITSFFVFVSFWVYSSKPKMFIIFFTSFLYSLYFSLNKYFFLLLYFTNILYLLSLVLCSFWYVVGIFIFTVFVLVIDLPPLNAYVYEPFTLDVLAAAVLVDG